MSNAAHHQDTDDTPTDEVESLELTDDGLETPPHLVGTTRTVRVEKPAMAMRVHPCGPGLGEYSDHLLSFPTHDDDDCGDVPPGFVEINGERYRVVDERTIQECPYCGSSSVSAQTTPPHCFSCDRDLDVRADGGEDGGGRDTHDEEVVNFGIDVTILSIETLREEYAELNERKFSRLLSEDGGERLGKVWTELRQRVDVDQPECPECGARNWVFTDHTECAECAYGLRMGDEELLQEIQSAWDRIAGRGGEAR